MKRYRKTIKESIFLSHLLIISLFIVLTILVFDICLSFYIRSQTKNQLITAGTILKKSINNSSQNSNIILEGETNREFNKNLIKTNKDLKQIESFLNINYSILSKNKTLIYPQNDSEESSLLNNYLIPAIAKKRFLTSSIENSKVFFFMASSKKYAAILYPLQSSDNLKKGYILIYSDLESSKKLTSVVNIMLISISLLVAIIALIISNNVSEKISRPISQLSKYAEKIGERNYDEEPIQYDNEEIGMLSDTMNSMTQKLSTYDNTMKTFLQNSSHELRTPLMSIRGYTEGIKYGVVDDEGKAVDIIIDETERLSILVEDLLYLSKIDSMENNMNLEKINAANMIRSSIERVNGIALKNNKKINFNFDDNDIFFEGDEEKFTRAIINILGNCLRYAKENIDIFLVKDDKSLLITINDDGNGFNENDLPNVFERFFKGKGGNYGLGLAITKSIIEKHKGTITAQNNENGGASFKIRTDLNYL